MRGSPTQITSQLTYGYLMRRSTASLTLGSRATYARSAPKFSSFRRKSMSIVERLASSSITWLSASTSSSVTPSRDRSLSMPSTMSNPVASSQKPPSPASPASPSSSQ